jgi:hypothetical protein
MSENKNQESTQIPMLEQRRIEALIVKNIFEVLVDRHGEKEAKQAITIAIKNAAIEQGNNFRTKHINKHGDEPSLLDFSELGRLWEMGGALKRKVHIKTNEKLEYDIIHCAYADMYKEMGLAHIGDLLSCNRDGTFCIGYNPKMKLKRSQTIMEGADFCDFRYEISKDEEK